MFRSDFRKKVVCSATVRKMLYRNKFCGKWIHFQISLSLCQLQMIRYLLCVRDIAQNFLNTLLLLFILKSSELPEVYCRKRCSYRFRKFFRKTAVLDSLFNKVATQVFSSQTGKIFKNTCFKEHLWTTTSVSSCNFFLQCMKMMQLRRPN